MKFAIKLDAVDAAEKLAASILDTREREIRELEAQIEADNKAAQDAQNAQDAAADTGDIGAYTTAKTAAVAAMDAAEMHIRRLDKLQARALISETEYTAHIDAIKGEWESNRAAAMAVLFDLAKQVLDLDKQYLQAAKRTNRALQTMQHGVFRDADRARSKDGTPLGNPHKVSTGDVHGWAEVFYRTYQFKKYAEETGVEIEIPTDRRPEWGRGEVN